MPRTVSYFQTNTHLFDALNLHKTIFITRTELARGKLLEEIISSFGVGSRNHGVNTRKHEFCCTKAIIMVYKSINYFVKQFDIVIRKC